MNLYELIKKNTFKVRFGSSELIDVDVEKSRKIVMVMLKLRGLYFMVNYREEGCLNSVG